MSWLKRGHQGKADNPSKYPVKDPTKYERTAASRSVKREFSEWVRNRNKPVRGNRGKNRNACNPPNQTARIFAQGAARPRLKSPEREVVDISLRIVDRAPALEQVTNQMRARRGPVSSLSRVHEPGLVLSLKAGQERLVDEGNGLGLQCPDRYPAERDLPRRVSGTEAKDRLCESAHASVSRKERHVTHDSEGDLALYPVLLTEPIDRLDKRFPHRVVWAPLNGSAGHGSWWIIRDSPKPDARCAIERFDPSRSTRF